MGAPRRYAVIDPATGKLDRRIFSDEAVYADEMERIFGRAWLMIGHESLVPAPDDFFHTYMGQDPVILTRDGAGRLHALLNMCRHRGNRVVRCDDGNQKRFMCTYHGWTYRNDGSLEHVPGESEAYYGALDKSALGLIAARVETYAGIVFATWDSDAPSLEAYLGDARWYLDTVFNRSDGGMQALGPMKWLEPVNWKTLVDNCSDNYHVPTSHLSSARVQTSWLGRPPLSHADQFRSPSKHAFVNGHAITFRAADDNAPRYVHGMSHETMRLFQEYHDATLPEAERRLGTLRARGVQLANHSLFPNGILGFRLALPRGPRQTEFWHFVLLERDAPEELKRVIRIGSQANNGAAGLFEQDDVDNWRQVTEASASPLARRQPQDLSMGLGHAGPHPDYPGLVAERYISENNQRLFYRRWQEFMNAESWADIALDPISARFDGTATMRG
ncbi:MAG TPA: Rieske 2Fe-2S domain-containing protein [Stellaceae bacterium]|nr:Rieske 2Fe-2S domain-containing protein [Stellaceae bacterium]